MGCPSTLIVSQRTAIAQSLLRFRCKGTFLLSAHLDDFRYRPFTERCGKKLGMNARSPSHNNNNIFRMIRNPDVLRIAHRLEPTGAALQNGPLCPTGEPREWNSGLLKEIALDLL